MNAVLDYISYDSKYRANRFRDELKTKIEALVFMPYKFKQSIYFDDENIRDLVFKGYTIPYKIDEEKNRITIIGINKYRKEL
ncbi:type II toxin-antitoxin system RelE/ParE family toxin [Sulfurovum sp. bin170]|uniref:type II toxin-antitoxin system RelE/ParE family toxin n=1 Tax=Sulfurovum sp. bin170 TaxID=2695268 RepID=UPI0013DE92F3|nr:type II toxin-antitoxin system RelE/ParE family toxin [Sulfurovum sp. bin170]NEW61382.1 type II toxin-antitoxin system RelE/ParE family toxin [Sulfurovum sp. bin170]